MESSKLKRRNCEFVVACQYRNIKCTNRCEYFMTQEDAKKVAAIIETADGGCKYCVEDLKKQIVKAFPEHYLIWATIEV